MDKIIDSKELKLPNNWGELTSEDVLFVTKQKMVSHDKSDFMSQCIIYFLGLKPSKGVKIVDENILFRFSDKNKRNYYVNAITILTLFDEIEWLNDTLNLMKCPIFKQLKCPNYKLYRTTLEEYLNIDNYYCNFVKDNNELNLDIFFKSLYYGSKSDFKKITEFDKMAVVFWYSGFKIWLREKYPLVFSNESESDSEDEFNETPIEEYLMGLMSSLNEGRVADNDIIKKNAMHEVFFELNKKIEISQKIKK